MIMDHPVCKVASAKYLGVTITHNLSWTKHVDIITYKANSVRAFLQRNLSQYSYRVKSLAYFTYVRPILQWFGLPLLQQDRNGAARFVFNDYKDILVFHTYYQQLNWDSLECRTNAIIVMFYNNIVSVDFSNFLHRSFPITRGHHMRFNFRLYQLE